LHPLHDRPLIRSEWYPQIQCAQHPQQRCGASYPEVLAKNRFGHGFLPEPQDRTAGSPSATNRVTACVPQVRRPTRIPLDRPWHDDMPDTHLGGRYCGVADKPKQEQKQILRFVTSTHDETVSRPWARSGSRRRVAFPFAAESRHREGPALVASVHLPILYPDQPWGCTTTNAVLPLRLTSKRMGSLPWPEIACWNSSALCTGLWLTS